MRSSELKHLARLTSRVVERVAYNPALIYIRVEISRSRRRSDHRSRLRNYSSYDTEIQVQHNGEHYRVDNKETLGLNCISRGCS